MNTARQEQAFAYKEEFEKDFTSNERRAEIVAWMQERAAEDGESNACTMCKKLVVSLPWHEAVAEGHVYSRAGEREYFITKYCEFCFDKITAEPEEEEVTTHG